MKKTISILVLMGCAVLLNFSPSFADEAVQPAEAAAPQPVKFDNDFSRIARADSDAAIIKIAEEAIAKCAAADDFERFADGIKGMVADKPGFKYTEALYYAIAKARLDELAFLSRKNDIDSGRLYMMLSERYRSEASEYIDKGLASAKSKDLMLDLYFLKFLVTKEQFQPQKTEAFLNEIAEKISKYSNDDALNKRRLNKMAEQFNAKGMGDYALKLKIAYSQKVDPKAAQDILEDIKKDGDKNFAQGNMKSAASIYDTYINAGQAYLGKDIMAAKLMEIAEKYFGANRFREARNYYEAFERDYPDSKVMDYCKYKMALCYYYEKNYAKAVENLEGFLKNYQNSVWFDRAFETLCRLYFSDFPKDTALNGLQELVKNYYRKNIGDLAYTLIALEYYADKEYDKALEILKKININSAYSYTADIITADIKDIKNGSSPSFTFGSKDMYRMWEPAKPITLEMIPMEAGDASAWLKGGGKGEDKKLEVTYTEAGDPQITVQPGARIRFTMATLAEEDKFAEYLQDKTDLSRLPKKVKEESEKDLLLLQWKSDAGKFADERQTRDKVWQAPNEPGAYKVSISVDDLGLVRMPDKGIRKDSVEEVNMIINVKETS
ncbi:MAG: tetratricopeptide repeat protein [Candidatus Omnitrophica bacterium]|nr:tetratricopeptide repeat protein [Candidatus Omnitrophota bacterium]